MEAEFKDPMRWEAELHDPMSRDEGAKDLERKRREAAMEDKSASTTSTSREAKIMKDDRTKRWYEALKTANCMEVSGLLTEDPELIHEGWKADVQGSIQGTSKGRTALHVAARRGDVRLARQIVEMSLHMTQDFRDSFLEIRHQDYELDALAMAVINGNHYMMKLLRSAASFRSSGYLSLPIPEFVKNYAEDVENSEVLEEKKALSKLTGEVLDDMISSQEEIREEFDTYMERMVKKGRTGTPRIRRMYILQWLREIIGYDEDYDFNFLHIELYLFHFTISKTFVGFPKYLTKFIRTKIFSEAREKDSLRYLLFELRDGQGRTPLHVAVDCPGVRATGYLRLFLSSDEENDLDADRLLNIRDSADRTPLYRAAATGNEMVVYMLTRKKLTNANALVHRRDEWGSGYEVGLNTLSSKNGFNSDGVSEDSRQLTSNALHVAIIHKHESLVNHLFCYYSKHGHGNHVKGPAHRSKEGRMPWECNRKLTWPLKSLDSESMSNGSYVSALQLAVLVDSTSIVRTLLQAQEDEVYPCPLSPADDPADDPDYDPDRDPDHPAAEFSFPSFLLAAGMGNPGMIEVFLDSNQGQFDPFLTDGDDNTALHYAVKRKPVQFLPHLLDFVSCQHVLSWRRKNYGELSHAQAIPQDARDVSKDEEIDNKLESKEECGQRKGCILSLFHAGIDIWAKSRSGKTASPEPDAPEDFVTWWYERVAQETEKVQENLNAAANAISVTAALVATASYVGPLQPPLSYGGNPSGVQVQILSIRIFIICDTISFYLALAAIMLSLLPSLPQPQQSIFKVMRKTRTLVALAVSCLFPSIICVLIAFAASSIAVVPDHGLSYHGLTVATAAGCGFICLLVILWFADGLWNVLKTLPVIQTTILVFVFIGKVFLTIFRKRYSV